jgi:hypothetical protein
MKSNIYIKKLFCFSLWICFVPPALSITDEEIITALEANKDWEAAYSLATSLAERQKTYQAWRDVAIKYAKFDTDDKAYLQAWQHAYTLNLIPTYQNFLKIRVQSPQNRHAIYAIFKLVRASNTPSDYLTFLADFPDVVESIEALLKIQEIAWKSAVSVNDPLVFDQFVITFIGAKQIVDAIDMAFEVEKQRIEKELHIEKELNSVKSLELLENIARRLFNEARVAEKQQNRLVAARKYRLLNLEKFKETKVFIKLLDTEERLAYQKLKQAKIDEIAKSINDMLLAIKESLPAKLIEKIPQSVKNLPSQLEEIIALTTNQLEQQIEQVNENIKQGNLGHVGADIALFGTGSKIAQIIGRISPILENPSKYQGFFIGKKAGMNQH